jgi:hypothetical protein
MSTPENPQAFPVSTVRPGMTLRDWFAGQVVPAVIAATSAGQHHPGGSLVPNDERSIAQRIAADAYDLADAMLAARTKGTPA